MEVEEKIEEAIEEIVENEEAKADLQLEILETEKVIATAQAADIAVTLAEEQTALANINAAQTVAETKGDLCELNAKVERLESSISDLSISMTAIASQLLTPPQSMSEPIAEEIPQEIAEAISPPESEEGQQEVAKVEAVKKRMWASDHRKARRS